MLISPGFRYTYLLRKCKFYHERGSAKFWVYRLLIERYKYKYGFGIPYSCSIGKGFFIGHFGQVFINPRVKIGDNVNIAPGITLGNVSRGDKIGAPQIGDRVWIGTKAIIVGNIKIENGALIGPGAYVNFDVPENAVVIGNPGKIVSFKGSEGYINRVYEK